MIIDAGGGTVTLALIPELGHLSVTGASKKLPSLCVSRSQSCEGYFSSYSLFT